MDVNLTVAGTPGHTVTITIFEGSAILAEGSSTRRATDPEEHRVVFDDLRFTLAEGFVTVMEYDPLLDELGDNPAWLNLTYEDGSSVSLFHNFNVVQEETHLWTVDLDPLLTGLPVHLVGYAYDPGADDLTLRWDLGDGTPHVLAHGSEGAPTRATVEVVHTFSLGTFTVTFEAEDEDGDVGRDEAVVTSTEDGLFIDNVRPRAELGSLRQVAEDEIVVFEAVGQDTASDREDLSYVWLFRDGTQAVGPTAEHAFAQAGTYHVLLVVTDPHGESTVDSVRVEVANLPPVPTFGPVGPAEEDQPVTFDAAATADTPSDQPTLRYRWDFGDGSVATGPLAVHSYPRAGTYTVTLVVQDDNGAFASFTRDVEVVNRVPTAAFEGPAEVFVEEVAQFVSTSGDTPVDAALLDLTWAVDDAQTSGRTLTVTGFAPADLTIELAATDDDGAADTFSRTLQVKNRPPEAHIPFDAFFVYGEMPEAAFRGLAFDTLDDQDDLAFAWAFGDGSTAAGPTVAHTYGASGSFALTLTVTDRHGVVDKDTAVVNVILDADLDGLPDLYETDVSETDPASNDSDGDRVLDPVEVLVLGTDPLLRDTDFDAWTDFEEVFAVHGYVTDPLAADTDGDGLPDGSELYTQAFRTTERVAVPDGGSVTVPLFNVASGAPGFAVERADARLGVVHPRTGNLTALVVRNGANATVDVPFPEAPNLLVSVDLLEAGFTSAQLTTPGTWRLEIESAGDRGIVEYFEIHIAARTSPVAADSDGDGLNDTEETNPGDDGWVTDPWRVDTDGDGIADAVEVGGWRRTEAGIVPDPQGFRTDPTRHDTDRDGFPDGVDRDPLLDLMVRLTPGAYEALDPDPDVDDVVLDPGLCPVFPHICNQPWPDPFLEVHHRRESFYTPQEDPQGMSANFSRVYTLDVRDDRDFAVFTLRAWDRDPVADKQWDLSPTSSCAKVISHSLTAGSGAWQTTSGEAEDGDADCGVPDFGGNNAAFDARLEYRVETLRLGRINTILVDALDTDDLVETTSGDLRYLGDDVFYLAWLNVTSASGPFVRGLNAVLVPRAQFFNSTLNHALQTATDPANLPAYLRDLVFTAFDPAAPATTKALAGVLHGNLTGFQAGQLLGALTRGPDDVVNGRATVVTDQLATLGLPDALVQAVPWQGVVFDETGPGPGDLLGRFVEAFVNAAAFVVQGLVLIGTAIADFFAQAVAFLVELGLAVIGAIGAFLGLVARATEVVREGLTELYSFLVAEFAKVIRAIMGEQGPRLRRTLSEVVTDIATLLDKGLEEFEDGSLTEATKREFASALFGPFFATLALLSFVLVLSMSVLGSAILPFAFLVSLVVAVAIPAVLLAIVDLDEIQLKELSVPTDLDPNLSVLFNFTRSQIANNDQVASSMGERTIDVQQFMLEMLANLFAFLAAIFATMFLAANLDFSGLGLLAQGLTLAIWAAAVSILITQELPAPISEVAKFGIGVIALTLAAGGILISIIGYLRALRDPTNTVKLGGVFGLSIGSAGAAAFYSGVALGLQ